MTWHRADISVRSGPTLLLIAALFVYLLYLGKFANPKGRSDPAIIHACKTTVDLAPKREASYRAYRKSEQETGGLTTDRSLRKTVLLPAGCEVSGASQSGTIGMYQSRAFVALVDLSPKDNYESSHTPKKDRVNRKNSTVLKVHTS